MSDNMLLKPVKGNNVTCDYECHLAYSNAPGLDFGVREGTKVFAAEDGEVIRSQWGDRGGRYLMIRHDDGRLTLYSHLSVLRVVSGERVERGQHIAETGNTGYSTGPHLHFAIKDNGQWVDPEPLIED